MMAHRKSPKYTCGDHRTNARCTFYESYVPAFSNIEDEDCMTIEETTKDSYQLLQWTKESIDLDGIDESLFDVGKVSDIYFKNKSRFLVKDVIEDLATRLRAIEGLEGDAEELNLDFKCLTQQCGTPITSLRELLQALIDKSCLQ